MFANSRLMCAIRDKVGDLPPRASLWEGFGGGSCFLTLLRDPFGYFARAGPETQILLSLIGGKLGPVGMGPGMGRKHWPVALGIPALVARTPPLD